MTKFGSRNSDMTNIAYISHQFLGQLNNKPSKNDYDTNKNGQNPSKP